MANPKESSKNNLPSSRSLDDLMKLLMKLNEKIRQEFHSSSRRKRESAPERLDLVIMILLQEEAKIRAEKKPKAPKTKTINGQWIERLFADIEKGNSHPE